jgi:hypothetical protein
MKAIYLLMIFIGLNSYSLVAQDAISLIQPYNKDTIETVYPLFSWYAADFSNKRLDVQYIYTLVELKKNQSANAGLIVNKPILKIDDIQGFQLSYPFDATDLKFNQRYGWRIQKKINGSIVLESDAWEFILFKKIDIPMKYAVLSSYPTSTVYAANNKGFYFKLKSRYNLNSDFIIKVKNDRSEEVEVEMGEDQKLGKDERLERTGDDFHFLKTENYPQGIYTLTVKDPKNNFYTTRFQIK